MILRSSTALCMIAVCTVAILAIWNRTKCNISEDNGIQIPAEIAVVLPKKLGEKTTVKFSIRNTTSRTVNVVGVKSDCTCIQMTDLPIKINPNSSTASFFTIELKDDTIELDVFQKQLVLYHDDSSCGLVVVVKCNVKEQ